MSEVSDSESLRLQDSLTVKTRSYFSHVHALSAARFARQAGSIETPILLRERHSEHRGLVVASIISSAAFLETAINEFFSDALEFPQGLSELSERARRLLGDMWQLGVPRTARHRTLNKYEIALCLLDKPRLDRGRNPYQDADLVVTLRNALIHYEPEWVTVFADSSADVAPQALEKKIKGKFELNPLTGPSNAFFPDKCLGYGCAAWAIRSSISFVDFFFSEIGKKSPIEGLQSQLDTKA